MMQPQTWPLVHPRLDDLTKQQILTYLSKAGIFYKFFKVMPVLHELFEHEKGASPVRGGAFAYRDSLRRC